MSEIGGHPSLPPPPSLFVDRRIDGLLVRAVSSSARNRARPSPSSGRRWETLLLPFLPPLLLLKITTFFFTFPSFGKINRIDDDRCPFFLSS